MARYSLSLPDQLKLNAEELAKRQGVSLNQFIMWAVAEKVGQMVGLRTATKPQPLLDLPAIDFRLGGAGIYRPVLKKSGIHVKTIVVCSTVWNQTSEEIALEYDNVPVDDVKQALAYYFAHREEIDLDLAVDRLLEKTSTPNAALAG